MRYGATKPHDEMSVPLVGGRFPLLFDSGSVKLIYIGRAPGTFAPIVDGTFGDGQSILDPDTGVPLGAWQSHGMPRGWAQHLDHLHIEMKPSILGNLR
jgi:hypothetical protein